MSRVFGLDRWIALALFVFSVVYLYFAWMIPDASFNDPVGPQAFPKFLGIAALALSVILFLQSQPSQGHVVSMGAAIGIATSVAVTIGFVVLMPIIGFLGCLFLVSAGFLISLREPPVRAVVWSVALTAVFYVVFVTILNTPIPDSIMGGMF